MNRDRLHIYSRADIGIALLLFLFTALYISTAHAESDVSDTLSSLDAVSGVIDKHHVYELTKTGSRTAYIVLANNEGREERGKKDDDDDDDDDDEVPPTVTDNIIATHDRNSTQFNKNCSECHEEIHTRQTLDPLIRDAHVAMLPFAPGETDSNDKCTWCHRSVDLVRATGSPLVMPNSIRKRIDPRLCTMCHGPGGPAKQFYQVNLSSLQLDGSELYDLICSGCHKVLADSEVKGESAAEIQKKINEDEGGMGPLGVLKTEQIQAIAAALAQ